LPGIQTSHEADALAAQQDQERARELMIGYQGNSNDNLGVRDHFAPAPTVVADVADPTPGRVGIGGGSGGQLTVARLTVVGPSAPSKATLRSETGAPTSSSVR